MGLISYWAFMASLFTDLSSSLDQIHQNQPQELSYGEKACSCYAGKVESCPRKGVFTGNEIHSARHRSSDRYHFVLENTISVQMDQ